MKEIAEINLSEIVVEANDQLISEKRKGLVSLMAQKLNELNQAVARKLDAQKKLDAETKNIERLTAWINKVKEGDWSVINLSEKDGEIPKE